MGNKVNNCKFCEIASQSDKNLVLYEDDYIVIFNDIKPSARIHLLVVPKFHIVNANYLTKEHLNLLEHMKTKAIEYLKNKELIQDEDKDEFHMGFHVPPFVMIPHLHLHVLLPPFKSKLAKSVMFGYMFRPIDLQMRKLLELVESEDLEKLEQLGE
jgi:diadenosine tetraphosphate (Ap4A) HIT family hydrolase